MAHILLIVYRAQHPEVRFERQPIPVFGAQADLRKQGENVHLVKAFGRLDTLQEAADVALVREQCIIEQIAQLQGREFQGAAYRRGHRAERTSRP